MEKQERSLVISKRSIQIGVCTITYTLRRNRRAKRVTLRVDQKGLTMTVPWSFPQDQLDPFIKQRQDWLFAALDRFSQARSNMAETVWSPADGVILLGRHRQVRFAQGDELSLAGDVITLPGRMAEDPMEARSALEQWLQETARLHLSGRLTTLGALIGASPVRFTLRNQKTRWGSCSSQGGISLNWRLIMAPPAVIDYVVIHELAHILEMNHSERFWQIVARYDPNYREHRSWLRENGASLFLKP